MYMVQRLYKVRQLIIIFGKARSAYPVILIIGYILGESIYFLCNVRPASPKGIVYVCVCVCLGHVISYMLYAEKLKT